jgi:hypothetical protein
MRAALVAAVALAPALADACSACARDQTPYAPLLIGALIAAPYLVAAVVIRAIRSGEGEP